MSGTTIIKLDKYYRYNFEKDPLYLKENEKDKLNYLLVLKEIIKKNFDKFKSDFEKNYLNKNITLEGYELFNLLYTYLKEITNLDDDLNVHYLNYIEKDENNKDKKLFQDFKNNQFYIDYKSYDIDNLFDALNFKNILFLDDNDENKKYILDNNSYLIKFSDMNNISYINKIISLIEKKELIYLEDKIQSQILINSINSVLNYLYYLKITIQLKGIKLDNLNSFNEDEKNKIKFIKELQKKLEPDKKEEISSDFLKLELFNYTNNKEFQKDVFYKRALLYKHEVIEIYKLVINDYEDTYYQLFLILIIEIHKIQDFLKSNKKNDIEFKINRLYAIIILLYYIFDIYYKSINASQYEDINMDDYNIFMCSLYLLINSKIFFINKNINDYFNFLQDRERYKCNDLLSIYIIKDAFENILKNIFESFIDIRNKIKKYNILSVISNEILKSFINSKISNNITINKDNIIRDFEVGILGSRNNTIIDISKILKLVIDNVDKKGSNNINKIIKYIFYDHHNHYDNDYDEIQKLLYDPEKNLDILKLKIFKFIILKYRYSFDYKFIIQNIYDNIYKFTTKDEIIRYYINSKITSVLDEKIEYLLSDNIINYKSRINYKYSQILLLQPPLPSPAATTATSTAAPAPATTSSQPPAAPAPASGAASGASGAAGPAGAAAPATTAPVGAAAAPAPAPAQPPAQPPASAQPPTPVQSSDEIIKEIITFIELDIKKRKTIENNIIQYKSTYFDNNKVKTDKKLEISEDDSMINLNIDEIDKNAIEYFTNIVYNLDNKYIINYSNEIIYLIMKEKDKKNYFSIFDKFFITSKQFLESQIINIKNKLEKNLEFNRYLIKYYDHFKILVNHYNGTINLDNGANFDVTIFKYNLFLIKYYLISIYINISNFYKIIDLINNFSKLFRKNKDIINYDENIFDNIMKLYYKKFDNIHINETYIIELEQKLNNIDSLILEKFNQISDLIHDIISNIKKKKFNPININKNFIKINNLLKRKDFSKLIENITNFNTKPFKNCTDDDIYNINILFMYIYAFYINNDNTNLKYENISKENIQSFLYIFNICQNLYLIIKSYINDIKKLLFSYYSYIHSLNRDKNISKYYSIHDIGAENTKINDIIIKYNDINEMYSNYTKNIIKNLDEKIEKIKEENDATSAAQIITGIAGGASFFTKNKKIKGGINSNENTGLLDKIKNEYINIYNLITKDKKINKENIKKKYEIFFKYKDFIKSLLFNQETYLYDLIIKDTDNLNANINIINIINKESEYCKKIEAYKTTNKDKNDNFKIINNNIYIFYQLILFYINYINENYKDKKPITKQVIDDNDRIKYEFKKYYKENNSDLNYIFLSYLKYNKTKTLETSKNLEKTNFEMTTLNDEIIIKQIELSINNTILFTHLRNCEKIKELINLLISNNLITDINNEIQEIQESLGKITGGFEHDEFLMAKDRKYIKNTELINEYTKIFDVLDKYEETNTGVISSSFNKVKNSIVSADDGPLLHNVATDPSLKEAAKFMNEMIVKKEKGKVVSKSELDGLKKLEEKIEEIKGKKEDLNEDDKKLLKKLEETHEKHKEDITDFYNKDENEHLVDDTDRIVVNFSDVSELFKTLLKYLLLLCIFIYIIVLVISFINVINLIYLTIKFAINLFYNPIIVNNDTLSFKIKEIVKVNKDDFSKDTCNVFSEQLMALSVFNMTIYIFYILLAYLFIYILWYIYYNKVMFYTHKLVGDVKEIDPDGNLMLIIALIFALGIVHIVIYKFILKNTGIYHYKKVIEYESNLDNSIVNYIKELSPAQYTDEDKKFYLLLIDSTKYDEISAFFEKKINELSNTGSDIGKYILIYNLYNYFSNYITMNDIYQYKIGVYLQLIAKLKNDETEVTFLSLLDSSNKRLIKLTHEDLSFYKNIPKDKIELFKPINNEVINIVTNINKSIITYSGTFIPFILIAIYIIVIFVYNIICIYILFETIHATKAKKLFPDYIYTITDYYKNFINKLLDREEE